MRQNRAMRPGILAALLAFALSSPCAAASIDFDRGVDASAVLKAAAQQPAPPPVRAQWSQHKGWLSECKDVEVPPGRDRSETLPLTSVELTEECDFQPQGGLRCFPSFGATVRKDARLLFVDRPHPTPTERFRVCLDGYELYVEYMSGRYEQKARPDGTIVLTPR